MNAGQLLVAMEIAVDVAVANPLGATEQEREDHRAWMFVTALRHALKRIAPDMAAKLDTVVRDRNGAQS